VENIVNEMARISSLLSQIFWKLDFSNEVDEKSQSGFDLTYIYDVNIGKNN
jgi:hypothetical protein